MRTGNYLALRYENLQFTVVAFMRKNFHKKLELNINEDKKENENSQKQKRAGLYKGILFCRR